MAKLEFKLSKEQHEALDESLKQFYVATQDGGFELEGVGSIQRALEAEKAAKTKAIADAVEKAKADVLKPYEGLDVEAAKAAIDAAKQAEEDKHKKAGDFDSLKKQLEDRHTLELEKKETEKKALADEKDKILSNLKLEKLANVLTEKGVLPERVEFLRDKLEKEMELVLDDQGFSLKKIGGVGDTKEFETMIEDLRSSPKTDYFFKSTNASGSGASGSQNNGGGQSQTWKREQWETASDSERIAFTAANGKVTD